MAKLSGLLSAGPKLSKVAALIVAGVLIVGGYMSLGVEAKKKQAKAKVTRPANKGAGYRAHKRPAKKTAPKKTAKKVAPKKAKRPGELKPTRKDMEAQYYCGHNSVTYNISGPNGKGVQPEKMVYDPVKTQQVVNKINKKRIKPGFPFGSKHPHYYVIYRAGKIHRQGNRACDHKTGQGSW